MTAEERALQATKVIRKLSRGLRVDLRELGEILDVGTNWFNQRVTRGTVELVDLFRILEILKVEPHIFFGLIDPDFAKALLPEERVKLARYEVLVRNTKIPGVAEDS